MRRRRLLAVAGAAVTGGIAGCRGESERTTPAFRLSSPAIETGGTLPAEYTCVGAGRSPPVTIERVPEPTAALAMTAEADLGPINEPVFWSLWNVPPDTDRIPEGVPRTGTVPSLDGARQGKQSGGTVGYSPPCPPAGVSVELRFQGYALRDSLSVAAGTKHDDVVEALQQTTLASSRITVTYTRPETAGTETGSRR